MAYAKQTWNNNVSGGTPITAEKLNHIEDGIYNAAKTADTVNSNKVPTSRTVNGKALSSNITLAASDVKTSAGTTLQAWTDANSMTKVLQKAYPVGAIYLSTVSTSPKTLFGFGTWVQITDRFLLAAGTTYKAGGTGGAATHTLTVNQIPAHKHATMEYQSGRTGIQGGSADGIQWGYTLTNTWKLSTGSAGGGAAHNNMPPYLVVYIWKRTA